MKKIILYSLIIGLFLISGCSFSNFKENNTDSNIHEIQGEFKKADCDSRSPIRLEITHEFEVKKNSEKMANFTLCNFKAEKTNFTVKLFCSLSMDSNANPTEDIIFEHSNKIEINRREGFIVPFIIKATEDSKPTTYLCKILIGPDNYASSNFYVTVVNP